LFGGALLVAAFVGFKAGHLLSGVPYSGWATGLVVFGGLSMLINKVYSDRVVFNRVYRTR